MEMMGVVHSSRLLLFLVLFPLAITCVWLAASRRAALEKLGLPATRLFGVFSLIFFFLSIAAFIIALARPIGGYHDEVVYNSGHDVLFLVDISASMTAEDVHPSRLEAAKRKLIDAVRITEESARLDRLGIIAFSGTAFVYCAPTADYAMFRTFVKELSPNLTTSLGSSIKNALSLAARMSDTMPSKPGQFVLITDGDDPDAESAARELHGKRLSLSIIGIGTPEGAEVTSDESTAPGAPRAAAVTKLDELNLHTLAEAAKGMYVSFTLDDSDIRRVMRSEVPLVRVPTKVRSYEDFGPFLSLAGLILGLLFLRTQKKHLWLSTLIFCLSLPVTAARSEPLPSLREGYLAYESGRYKDALEVFMHHTALAPDDRKVRTALAGALFKMGKIRESLRIYTGLLSSSRSGRERFELHYNAGNCHFALEEYPEALAAFDAALEIKKDDERARFNRDLTELYLEARTQAKPPEQAGSENERSLPNAENTAQPDRTPNPSDLGIGDDGPSERETAAHTEELRLIPSIGDDSSSKQHTPSWLDALPDTPLLPENGKEAQKQIPDHWW